MATLKDETGRVVLIVPSAEEARSGPVLPRRRVALGITRKRVVKALQGHTETLSGRSVAEAAGLRYKATIDALGWLHDTGVVVRIGRKYRVAWALSDSPAAPSTAALDRLQAA